MDGNTQADDLIVGDQLRMYLQPKVDACTGLISGAEALARWQHPLHGLIQPAAFIPVAEKTGVIAEITGWMLEQVCRQIAAWKAAGLGTVPVSVNVPACSFISVDLVDRIDRLLRKYQLTASCLVLEVTEALLARNIDKCIERMGELRHRGIAVSLDDFGTGVSSLSFLKTMLPDELKLDCSFVADIGKPGTDPALAALIIELAQKLGLSVVAEGVETQVQASALMAMGCHIHQGYLYGRPMPAAEFASLLMLAEHAALRIA